MHVELSTMTIDDYKEENYVKKKNVSSRIKTLADGSL